MGTAFGRACWLAPEAAVGLPSEWLTSSPLDDRPAIGALSMIGNPLNASASGIKPKLTAPIVGR